MRTEFHILPVSTALDAELRHAIDRKTKPLGALGRLEDLALQLGRIQGTLRPVIERPRVIVFAGDHGIAAEGVSAYPQDVTWQMVMNFVQGGAAVNALARSLGVEVEVVDAGVAHHFGPLPGLVDAKRGHGTRNCATEPAMTPAQCEAALACGRLRVQAAQADGCTLLAFGEMGIANTSAASLLLHKLRHVPLEVATGRGTGLDDAGLVHKRAVLARAAARTGGISDGREALVEYGGFEIAMMAGAMLGAAEAGIAFVVDGFITGSAFLAAQCIEPALRDHAIFAHRSAEAGHGAMLELLHADPLLDLGLRLGEGTGAVLAVPLLRAACAFLGEMASFDSAGVSEQGG
ncbi:nicotinate-nucleotide--dimethylbenzimidazole phosphoribosyltransferase [Ideonella sp. 4Y11]|uniref:Nicotinate-nucleotide--dimethylbenzimidazole phosphoribosyltransferase n=1 Tax=Ideonella aquatica TaxID=2824119 RepID=A0A940YII1_9BURK|nr:nicotinate-nucleotide--dimethylbenzimidazole phosphoribosyltransferase [Ideonella aquatica]MBQ0959342.1 nicotinate-nucleotide--dimethylbenzimidazole phosphoribosyltransferase [Ideonella aquatica]